MSDELFGTEEGVVDTGNDPVDSPDSSPAGEAPKPDIEARFQAAQERGEALQQELTEARIAADARLKQMEGFIGAAFSRPAEPRYVEPEISDEEFAIDPRGAARKMAQLEAARAVQYSNQQTARVLGSVIERAFNSEYVATQALDPNGFNVVKQDLDAYFYNNPQAKAVPGAVDEAYNYFAGRAYREGRLAPRAPGSRMAPTSPSTRPPSPDGPRPKPAERKLNAEQERLAKIYGMTTEEWFSIEGNPEYHKSARDKSDGR